ncbi:MAG: AAA family ATPase [Burkholderiales bacterium]
MGAIYVLAGTNGAGKSSIGGALLRAEGVQFYDPDDAARRLRAANPSLSAGEANGLAWQQGVTLLQRAIAQQANFAFETTLGGDTITRLLEAAIDAGLEVHVWYAGLASVARHVQRVRARVARGGHDIPEDAIRRRYVTSRLNLIRLLPRLSSLRVYDNSADGDPARGLRPRPVLVLHLERGGIVGPADLSGTPAWAKPIVAAALNARRPSA